MEKNVAVQYPAESRGEYDSFGYATFRIIGICDMDADIHQLVTPGGPGRVSKVVKRTIRTETLEFK